MAIKPSITCQRSELFMNYHSIIVLIHFKKISIENINKSFWSWAPFNTFDYVHLKCTIIKYVMMIDKVQGSLAHAVST